MFFPYDLGFVHSPGECVIREMTVFALHRRQPGDMEKTQTWSQRDYCLKSDFCHNCVALFEVPFSVQLSDQRRSGSKDV